MTDRQVIEYKGDALAKFIAVMIFNEPRDIERVCCNYNFYRAAMLAGLKPEEAKFNRRSKFQRLIKPYADAYEITLWEMYVKLGLKVTIAFFKNTALKTYLESQND